jgi:hypothetical protein
MPEQLLGPDGKPVDIDAAGDAFSAAMAAPDPGEAPDYPAPPKRAPREEKPPRRKPESEKPRVTSRAKPKAASPAGAAQAAEARKAGIDGLLQLTGAVMVTFPGCRADAAALALHGEALSDALASTAAADERLGRALDRLLTAGPYTALVMAVVPLGAQIAANHGVLPVGFMGAEDPAKLRAQVAGVLAEQEPAQAAA